MCLGASRDLRSDRVGSDQARKRTRATTGYSLADVNRSELEAFLNVAASRGFTRAAVRLGLTQSSVSARIAALERELGSKLFERQAHNGVLTEAGRALLPFAQQMISLEDRARRAVVTSVRATDQVAPLRIGANSASVSWLVPSVLSRLHETRPQAQIVVTEAPTPSIMELLVAHEVDLAFVSPYLSHHRAEVVWSYESEAALFGPAGHPATARRIAAAELGEYPFIGYTVGPGRDASEDLISRMIQPPHTVVHTNSTHLTELLIASGVGVGFLPKNALLHSRARQAVALVDIVDYVPPSWRGLLVKWSGMVVGDLGDHLIATLRAMSLVQSASRAS